MDRHSRRGQDPSWWKKQLLANERIWDGFRQIELRMIAAASPAEILNILTTDLVQLFPQIDRVSIVYCDPQYELARLLEGKELEGRVIRLAQDDLAALFPQALRPRLGPCPLTLQRLLFPDCREPLGSCALVPLVLRGRVVGSLNQASRDASHFTSAVATDLLEHLAAVTALCLEHAVQQERLQHDVLTDPLTGVPNRRFFTRRLQEEIERWARHRQSLSCLLLDIDHFKQINDRFGHQAGDRVLQQVAQALGRDLRASDVLARYGGEEFVLLLPNTTQAQALAIAERLRVSIPELKFDFAPAPMQVTISAGLVYLKPDMEAQAVSGESLLQRADAALYRAKQAGRNRIVSAAARD